MGKPDGVLAGTTVAPGVGVFPAAVVPPNECVWLAICAVVRVTVSTPTG